MCERANVYNPNELAPWADLRSSGPTRAEMRITTIARSNQDKCDPTYRSVPRQKLIRVSGLFTWF